MGCITPAVWAIPTTLQRGTKSSGAHKWADSLHNPSRRGGILRLRAGDKIRSGPQAWGSGPQECRWLCNPYRLGGPQHFRAQEKISRCPKVGGLGYITPVRWGIPNMSEPSTKSAMGHKRVHWLHNPCRLGDPKRFRAGNKIRSGPQVSEMASSPLPSTGPLGGSPTLHNGVQNQKWPTNGHNGYITPAV